MKKLIYSRTVQLCIFSGLLIVTPFLMLLNYLQPMIKLASNATFSVSEYEIPYIVVIGLSIIILVFILNRKHITLYRCVAFTAVLSLWVLGQNSSDWYFSDHFYDLQHNWHYIAYGMFSILCYRLFTQKGFSNSKVMILTLVSALGVSSFDEIVQVFISNRIFDIGDIAKDCWGVIIGLALVYFVYEQGKIISNGIHLRARSYSLRHYVTNSPATLFHLALFAYFLLSISSVITTSSYLSYAITIPVFTWLAFFLLFHFSRNKIVLILSIILMIIIIGYPVYRVHFDKNHTIRTCSRRFVDYAGIPIPFFDIMVFPNGHFRIVDKKDFFNGRDLSTIGKYVKDILVIGTGHKGQGGKGLPMDTNHQFIYNTSSSRMIQVIRQPSVAACKTYNRLIINGKNVLLVLHNE
ncbi:MAG: VanZ family protein [Candidatus Cloacimonetes bacterium]|nr:VanZ family protein [Candidatus Cloacimonadota bacterium]